MKETTKAFKKQYYGDKEVKEIIKLEDKTYFGKERVKLVFDKDSFELPLEMFKRVVSKEPIDASTLVKKRVEHALSQVMAILVEAELNHFESTMHVAQELESLINQKTIDANTIMWGKEPRDISLRDVDKVLTPKKYEKGN